MKKKKKTSRKKAAVRKPRRFKPKSWKKVPVLPLEDEFAYVNQQLEGLKEGRLQSSIPSPSSVKKLEQSSKLSVKSSSNLPEEPSQEFSKALKPYLKKRKFSLTKLRRRLFKKKPKGTYPPTLREEKNIVEEELAQLDSVQTEKPKIVSDLPKTSELCHSGPKEKRWLFRRNKKLTKVSDKNDKESSSILDRLMPKRTSYEEKLAMKKAEREVIKISKKIETVPPPKNELLQVEDDIARLKRGGSLTEKIKPILKMMPKRKLVTKPIQKPIKKLSKKPAKIIPRQPPSLPKPIKPISKPRSPELFQRWKKKRQAKKAERKAEKMRKRKEREERKKERKERDKLRAKERTKIVQAKKLKKLQEDAKKKVKIKKKILKKKEKKKEKKPKKEGKKSLFSKLKKKKGLQDKKIKVGEKTVVVKGRPIKFHAPPPLPIKKEAKTEKKGLFQRLFKRKSKKKVKTKEEKKRQKKEKLLPRKEKKLKKEDKRKIESKTKKKETKIIKKEKKSLFAKLKLKKEKKNKNIKEDKIVSPTPEPKIKKANKKFENLVSELENATSHLNRLKK